MVKYIKNNKNKVCALLAILIVLLLFIGTTNLVVYGEVNSYLEFEQLDLQEELESISTFDFLAHPPVSSPTKIEPSIYKVIEYCYSYYSNYSSNYGVYVYMYNPNQLEILESGKNKITLATKHKVVDNAQIATDYEKFDLKFISKTSGAYNNLFYKFKIVDHKVDGKSMYERVNKLCRQYDISEIELQEKNELGANLLCKGGRFKFTGYAEGYGYDSEMQSTLQCTQEGIETLELDLNHTWFRTPTSSMGKGYQNQLDAVYFTVPNRILEDYGELKQIKAQWYEYKTSPVVVLHTQSYYDKLKGKEGVMNSSYNSALPTIGTNHIFSPLDGFNECAWGFNMPAGTVFSKFKSDFLTYIQYCDKQNIKDWVYKSKDLRDYIYSYNKSYHTGEIDVYSSVTNKKISNDLFVDFVDEGHTRGFNEKIFDADQVDQKFNLLDYGSNHSGWDKFKDYFFSYPKDQSYTEISPIMEVKKTDLGLSDEEFSAKYLVDKNQVSDFKDYVRKTKDTVYKFNFSFTQYESNDISYFYASIGTEGGLTKYGIMSQETVYLDFDVIWLKFVKGLDATIIPVAALPIDAIPDFTAPPWLDNNLWDSFLEMLMYILITIATIVIIVIFIRLFGMPILLFLSTRTKKPKNNINISIDSKQIKNAKKTKYNKYEVDLAKERFDRKKIKKE